tara:strand:+ start:1034 stop:1417 length:384 start_codon:yes stop_codon:yes gene_type:complete
MNSKLVFIYDGDCPFCNKFAELIELKSGLPNLTVTNARESKLAIKELYQKGYDIDQGAILLKNDEILHGASAINWICSQIKQPSDSLLRFISITFTTKRRTNLLFPFLLIGRRIILYLKGIPRKLVM